MDFPCGDERVTKCLHACVHEGRDKKSMKSSCHYQDDQVWNELSEEWQQYLMEKEESQAV